MAAHPKRKGHPSPRLLPFVTKGTMRGTVVCGNTQAADMAHNLLCLRRASWSFLTTSMGSDPT